MWEWTQSYSKDVAPNPERIPKEWLLRPPAKPLAFAAPWCDTVDRNFSHSQTARPDFTRPYGLFPSSQVETISSARKT